MSSRSDYKKLSVIIDALTKLKAEIKPEGEAGGDPYDLSKAKITSQIQHIKDDIKTLQAFTNDRDIIEKKTELRKEFGDVQVEMGKFAEVLKTIAKEKTKEPARRDARVKQGQQWLELAQEELMSLARQARDINVGDVGFSGGGGGGPGSREERREIERNRRKQRRERRRNRGGVADDNVLSIDGGDEIILDEMGPGSAQEQTFMKQVEQARQEEEEMLQQISQGLTELHELALTLNKLLKQSAELISDVDEKMDKVQTRLDNANERMEKLLEETGGMSRWCPICICLCLILACAGFLINKV